jgi:hypothetical protein
MKRALAFARAEFSSRHRREKVVRSTKPRWTQEQAVFPDREALKLLEARDGGLTDLLSVGVADHGAANATPVEAALSARPAFGAESKATTGAEHSFAHEAQDVLGRMRALLRHTAAKDDSVLRATSAGMKTSPGKASSVAAGLEAKINASRFVLAAEDAPHSRPKDELCFTADGANANFLRKLHW